VIVGSIVSVVGNGVVGVGSIVGMPVGTSSSAPSAGASVNVGSIVSVLGNGVVGVGSIIGTLVGTSSSTPFAGAGVVVGSIVSVVGNVATTSQPDSHPG